MNKFLLVAFLGLIVATNAVKHHEKDILAEVELCTPYFTTSGIQMVNGVNDPLAGWYLTHCKVQSPQNGQFINANSVTWTTANQPLYYHQAWACVSNGQATMYYPNNCTWSSGSLQTQITGSTSTSSYTTNSQVTTAQTISGVSQQVQNSNGVYQTQSQAAGQKSPSPTPTPVKAPSPSPSPVKAPSPSPSPVKAPSPSPVAAPSPSPSPVPQTVVQTLPIPSPSVLPPSPVIVKSTDIPPSVPVVTIPGTTLVIVAQSSVPNSVPSTSTVEIPPAMINTPATPSLATFTPIPVVIPSPSPSPVVLTTIPTTLPSPPTPTIIAQFPSSQVREVVHESQSTVVRQSDYITPSPQPIVPTWFQYIPSSSIPTLPSNCQISGVVPPSQIPSSLPVEHVTTIILHTHTTYFVQADVSSSAPPIFIYTLQTSNTIVVVPPTATTIFPSTVPTSVIAEIVTSTTIVSIPSTIPVSVVSTVSYVSTVSVVSTITVPPAVTIPSTWVTPVIVPISWVSTVKTSLIITVSTQPSIAIIEITNVPDTVPSTEIATVPSTLIYTVAVPSTIVQTPFVSTWISITSYDYITTFTAVDVPSVPISVLPPTSVIPVGGVVIPETYAPASACVFILPHSNIIVPIENVPSSVPSRFIVTIPTPSPVPSTLPIPETFKSPVVIPITELPSTVPYRSIVTVPGEPSIVVVPSPVVPSTFTEIIYVPSTHPLVPVPPQITEIPTPSWTTIAELPSSPVYIPATWASSVPSTEIITIPTHSSVVIVPFTAVPTSIPPVDVITVPTPVPTQVISRCISIISHYSFPVPPSSAFLA